MFSLFPLISNTLLGLSGASQTHTGTTDIFFFPISLAQLSPAREAFFVGVEEAFLTVFLSQGSVAVHRAQVQLSRKGFITGYQAAYRFWGAVRKPGLDAAEQK